MIDVNTGKIEDALFVPETVALDDLLATFAKSGKPLAIVMDEYGGTETLYDQSWSDVSILMETESGSLEHTEEDEEGNVTTHCTVAPTMCEWTAEVSYRIVETRPDGRFIEPDSGSRTYTASYYAVTENSQACMDEPENWSDITYTVTWSDGIASGTVDTLDNTLVFDEDVFINDCYRILCAANRAHNCIISGNRTHNFS